MRVDPIRSNQLVNLKITRPINKKMFQNKIEKKKMRLTEKTFRPNSLFSPDLKLNIIKVVSI
jgi:hypothetical protein